MTERRDAAPDDGTTPPEDVPPTPEELGEKTDDNVLESDIAEDITAPHPTVSTEPGAGAEAEGAPAEGAAAASGAAAATGRRPMRPDERRAARQAAVSPSARPAEPRVRIEDRPSRLFVLASIATFALILLYAMLLGQGGFLSPDPSPTPVVSASPSASADPSPGSSASPSVSPSAGTSASPSAGAMSGSPSPS